MHQKQHSMLLVSFFAIRKDRCIRPAASREKQETEAPHHVGPRLQSNDFEIYYYRIFCYYLLFMLSVDDFLLGGGCAVGVGCHNDVYASESLVALYALCVDILDA